MIEAVSKDNLDEVLPLIRAYQEFYKVADISDAHNKAFFSQFGEHNSMGCQFLFRQDGQAAGFATLYFTFSSSLAAKVGVMNDLFTISEFRGQGIGKALIEHCRAFAESKGAARLQWVTAMDNESAQAVYDSLDTSKSPWYIYTYSTKPK